MSIAAEPWVAGSGVGPVLVLLAYLAVVTVPLGLTDERELRLPNAYVVPGLLLLVCVGIGSIGSWATGSWSTGSWAFVIIACALAALVAGTGWVAGMLGMGDVKLAVLLAGAAALVDARAPIVWCAATGVLTLSSVAGVLAASRRPGLRAVAATRIPLGPSLLAAFWFAIAATLPP